MFWLPQRVKLCQTVSLVSFNWVGEGGVIGDDCGLSKSTYKEVSANGQVSDFRIVAIRTLTFDKAYHKKSFLVTLLLFVVSEKKPSIALMSFCLMLYKSVCDSKPLQ